MRDQITDQLLTAVRAAVAQARAGGVTTRACIWDATAAAVDADNRSRPSTEARRTANAACRAIEPSEARADTAPRPKAPRLARVLFAAANYLARRTTTPTTPEAPRA